MSTTEPETVIVAHRGERMKRAFRSWERAREWRDAVTLDYALTEVLVVDDD